MKINKKLLESMKDFDFQDDLSRMVDSYKPSELSLDDLDNVYAASSQPNRPDFAEFLKKSENSKQVP